MKERFSPSKSLVDKFKENFDPSCENFGDFLSERIGRAISSYAKRGETTISEDGNFYLPFLKLLSERLDVPLQEVNFYKGLHKELVQYVQSGGQINFCGKLKLGHSGNGIELSEVKVPKIPSFESIPKDNWIVT